MTPSRKFSKETQKILQPLYKHSQAIQSYEGRILKLHISLEIRAPNPILETHYFLVRRIPHSQICAILWGTTCTTSDRLWTFCISRQKFKHASYEKVWCHLAENCSENPAFFAADI